MKYLIIAILLMAFSQVTYAKRDFNKQLHIKKSVFACLTKTYYDRMTDSVARKDMLLLKSLIAENKCVLTSGKFKISILKHGFLSSYVKVYTHKGSVNLWVSSEFLVN